MTNGPTIPANKYSTIAYLGEGAHSKVYLGCNVNTNERVALKVCKKSKMTTEQVAQLQKEIEILKKLNSIPSEEKNILQLKDVIDDKERICLVSDYIEGGELHDYCDQYPNGVPERISKWIFKKVLNAVDKVHDNDICHLDLKLENVMYNKDSHQAKLIDFGFASETAEINPTTKEKVEKLQTNYCGSVHYAAPEIVKRTPFNGKKADVWSLGVLLFVLLSGLFPFDDSRSRVEVIFDKIVAAEFFTPSYLSSDAQSLLKIMLQADPTKRPTVKEVLKHPWFSVRF